MTPIAPKWPKYYERMLITKDKTNNIGIITLWSKKEIYEKNLKNCNYNTIGQLYSKEEGISYLIRNLLTNKHITDIVLVGVDLNHCKQTLNDFFNNGTNDQNYIISKINSKLHKEIPKTSLDNLRKNIKLHDLTNIKDHEEITKYIQKIKKQKPYGNYEEFEEPTLITPQSYPSLQTGFKITKKYIYEAWIEILRTLNKFGTIKESQYGDKQKELISLMTIITNEDPNNIKWSENFNFTKKDLENYIPQVTTKNKYEELDYTYGQRLMDHEKTNQIENMIEELKKESYSRRAIAFTWNVKKDYKNPKCPCLNLVQSIIQKNELHLTCYFRSNDLYDAWPRNAFALRKLQETICKKTKTDMGNLIIISNSAHIYERNFKKSIDIVKEEDSKNNNILNKDPNGSIIIETKDNKIIVTHLGFEGEILDRFESTTAIDAYKILSKEMKISIIEHALDIGCELQKAEIAIKQKLDYIQDKELVFE